MIKKILKVNTIKKILMIIFNLVVIFSMVLKYFYAQFAMKINELPLSSDKNTNMMIAVFFSVLIIYGCVLVISFKKLNIALIVTDFIFTLVIYGNILYGRYYYNPITISIFKQISFLDEVSTSMLELFKPMDIIMLLDFVILIPMYLYIKDMESSRKSFKNIFIGLIIIIIGVIGFKFKYVQMDTDRYVFERKYMAQDLGLPYYHYYDIKNWLYKTINTNNELSNEEIEVVESVNKAKVHTNVFTGIGEGKNLIIIQLEAMQNFLLDIEFEGQKIMPFMNQLKENSIYASNYYVQTAGGNTVDAELLTNTSLHPTFSGSAYYEYPTNTYLSLPLKLKEKGYSVNSFHGYEASFWNREVMHKTLGFDKFYSYDDFEINEKVGWAISDKAFLKQSIDKTLMASENNPFYSLMITLSSHYPYDAFYGGPFTKVDNGILNRYMNSAAYVDQVLADFFEYLKKIGVYDNSVIVIYGDHAGLFNSDTEGVFDYFNLPNNRYEWQKLTTIPLIIHIPGESISKTYTKVTGQIDLYPTLANIMGIELEYSMGQDFLDADYQSGITKRGGNVITDDYIYIAQENRVYDYKTGNVLNMEDYKNNIEEYNKQLKAMDLIYRSDYMKKYK